MSAANRKFQALNRQVIAWNARDHQEDKALRVDKFPHCRGTFDTCPAEEELNSALEKKQAPRVCGKCPVYHESGDPYPVEPRKLSPEEIKELQRVFGKRSSKPA